VLGDPEQGRAHLTDLGALDEGAAETVQQLGLALYRNDSLPGSIAALEIASRSLPADPAVGALLGDAREQRELSEDRSGWNLIPGPLPFVDGMCLPGPIAMAMGHWAGQASEPPELAAVKREIIAKVRNPHRIASAAWASRTIRTTNLSLQSPMTGSTNSGVGVRGRSEAGG